jgi:hypothetical protein
VTRAIQRVYTPLDLVLQQPLSLYGNKILSTYNGTCNTPTSIFSLLLTKQYYWLLYNVHYIMRAAKEGYTIHRPMTIIRK